MGGVVAANKIQKLLFKKKRKKTTTISENPLMKNPVPFAILPENNYSSKSSPIKWNKVVQFSGE